MILEFQVLKGNLYKRVNRSRTYNISFDIKPYGISKNWACIVYLVVDENSLPKYKQGIPNVCFHPDSTRLRIDNWINDRRVTFDSDQTIDIGIYSSVTILQQEDNEGRYEFSIHVNGVKLLSVENKKPSHYNNVNLYISNPRNLPAKVMIQNFVFRNLGEF